MTKVMVKSKQPNVLVSSKKPNYEFKFETEALTMPINIAKDLCKNNNFYIVEEKKVIKKEVKKDDFSQPK